MSAFGGQGGEPPLSAGEIFRRATTHTETSQPGAPGFTFTKRSLTEHLDSAGKLKSHQEKVWLVSIYPGSSSARLIEVNGHAPGPADLKEQNQRESNVRELLGETRDGRKPDRERDTFLVPEMLERFDFKLLGEMQVAGRRTYEIEFNPRQSPPPVRRMIDRMLNRLSGTVWIDAEEFELVRAHIHLSSQVDFFGGIAGRLHKLTYSITRKRLARGFWVNGAASGDFEGRKFLENQHVRTRSETDNFRSLVQG